MKQNSLILKKNHLNKSIKTRTAIKLQREITNSLRKKNLLGANQKDIGRYKNKTNNSSKGAARKIGNGDQDTELWLTRTEGTLKL